MALQIDEVKELVCLQLGIPKVAATDRFVEDLGAESADLVNLTAAAEDRFQVEFEEEMIADIRTVEQLFQQIKTLTKNSP